MQSRLSLEILAQPDDTTCGPTCLQAVYRYWGDDIQLEAVIEQASSLSEGGTLAVFMGCHALQRGYRATIYTYNLQVFDPTWFRPDGPDLAERLELQMRHKSAAKLQTASRAYLEFIRLGGSLKFEDLSIGLIRKFLDRSVPILTGLSATYLYRCAREFGPKSDYDDVRGYPTGHFVVLYGYDRDRRTVSIADPLYPNPAFHSHHYDIEIDRVIGAIFLGILTYDANLLIIEPQLTS